MNKTERLIFAGLLTLPLLAFLIAATPAGKRHVGPTIKWLGHPMVSDGASGTWLEEFEVGARSDGVIVWRPAAPNKKGQKQ